MKVINWDDVSDVAGRAAKAVARDWRIVEADDLKQECMTWAYENKEALGENPEVLYGVFRKVATRVATKERDYQDMMLNEYWYTPAEVRKVLKSIRDGSAQDTMKLENLDTCSIDDSKVIARADVVKAFKTLPYNYKMLLFRKFILDEKLSEADRKASYDAVYRLTVLVNRGTAKTTREINQSKGAMYV
jgi:hypothetical protein